MTEVRTEPHKTDEEIIAEDRNLVEKLGTNERSHLPRNPIQEELRALWHRTEARLTGRAGPGRDQVVSGESTRRKKRQYDHRH